MNKQEKNYNSGQTLIELVVSIAIFTIISFAALNFFSFTTNIFYQTMREEQIRFEHRIISYSSRTYIRDAQYYRINDLDEIVLMKEDSSIVDSDINESDVQLNEKNYLYLNLNEYIEGLSKVLNGYSVEIDRNIILISYNIMIGQETSAYSIKIKAPELYEEIILEEPEDLEDLEDSEEPEDLEDLEDSEEPEEPEDLEDLGEPEEPEEPEDIEDLEEPEDPEDPEEPEDPEAPEDPLNEVMVDSNKKEFIITL